MITLAKAAKTSMRRIVRRDRSQKVVAEAPKDAEPQSMFSRFRRPSSKNSKTSDRVTTDAATISLPATSTPSVGVAKASRKGMRTAVNKIKQHVSETLERLRGSLRGAQTSLTAAVAKTVQLEQQAEQLGELMETAQSAAATARQQASTAASAVGVLEHLEQQLMDKVKQLQNPLDASPELQAIEQSLKEQHEAIVQQKLKVMQWYTNAAEAQAVQEKALEMVGGAQQAFEAAQNEMAAAASALYEAQRATLAAKQMIIQAVSRAHLDEVREESQTSLEEEQLVLADRENDVVVVGHVSLAEKLRMEQGEVWQDVPAVLSDVYHHSAVLPQREDYEAAKQAASIATQKREMVALLAAEVATLASGGGATSGMWTSRAVREQKELEFAKKEECENKVRYLTTRLNWVRMAASRGAADDHPWIANTPVPEFEVENDPGVIAAIEQLHVAKADLLAVERKLACLDCTGRLQSMFADIEGRNVPEGQSVTVVAAQLMKDAVLAEIRAYRNAKYSQQAVQEACEAVLKGLNEAKGQVTPERSLSLMGLEPKRLQYFMHYYMETLPRRLSALTRPRPTTPAPSTPSRASPSPLSPSSISPLTPPALSASSSIGTSTTNGTSMTNGTSKGLTNGSANGRNGTGHVNGLKSRGLASPDPVFPPPPSSSNGTTLSNGVKPSVPVVNGSTSNIVTTPSVNSPQQLQSPDSGSDIARVRAALQGFLGAEEESKALASGFHPSFDRPGRLGKSREAVAAAHPLAGTLLEVGGPSSAGSLEAVVEVDNALLDSVRTRLALAQLLERGDNKVVRELYMSQLAADNQVGMGPEASAAVEEVAEEEAATPALEEAETGPLSEEAIDRVRHYYALQYLLERAANTPIADKSPSPPSSPRNPTPPATTTRLTSFALANLSDDSGSESGDSVMSDAHQEQEVVSRMTTLQVDTKETVSQRAAEVASLQEVSAITAGVQQGLQAVELAQALSAALVNEAGSSSSSSTATTPSASPREVEVATPTPVQKPTRVSRWVITLPRLVFTFKNPRAPTWDEVRSIVQEKGELTGSVLALTFASWGGLVGYHMDAAAMVSSVYLAAGIAAVSAINARTEKVAAQKASEPVVVVEEVAPSAPVAAVESSSALLSIATTTLTESAAVSAELDSLSEAAESVLAVSPTASDAASFVSEAASFATAQSVSFVDSVVETRSVAEAEVQSVAGSVGEIEAEVAVQSGNLWQRGKAWFKRVNAKFPELTGSVMALALGALGCVSAPIVHQ